MHSIRATVNEIIFCMSHSKFAKCILKHFFSFQMMHPQHIMCAFSHLSESHHFHGFAFHTFSFPFSDKNSNNSGASCIQFFRTLAQTINTGSTQVFHLCCLLSFFDFIVFIHRTCIIIFIMNTEWSQ